MQCLRLVLLSLLLFLVVGVCRSESATPDPSTVPIMSHQLRIRIGPDTFSATLDDNSTVAAFVARLPLTALMVELNGNEKYYNLPQSLPTNAASPGTVQAGDLLLYGSNTLVLFYDTFPTSYRYTRLGRVDNPTSLAAALGRGNVRVTLELQ